MATRKYNLRDEELPVLGRFVLESFERDFDDFASYSPDFNEDYKADYIAKLETIETFINPEKILAEQKKLTATLYEKIEAVRPMMSSLEGYVNRAGDGLTILPDDFGISEVRAKVNSKDQEGLIEALKIVIQNIGDNATILEEKGWTTDKNDALVALKDEINQLNIDQNAKMDERNLLSDENINSMNAFFDLLRDVTETGQRYIYKHTDREKVKDYTITNLLSRVRAESRSSDSEEI